jgi:sulfur-oxidizing protein SoxX
MQLFTAHRFAVIVGFFGIVGATIATAGATSPTVVRDGDLVPYAIVGDAIVKPLTSEPGEPARGLAVILDRKLGNCQSCHNIPIPNSPDHGNIGPDLTGVGKSLTAGQLRLRLVNMKVIDPQTIMPAYYREAGLHGVLKEFVGKPILTAQQIEDLVAYLQTLK